MRFAGSSITRIALALFPRRYGLKVLTFHNFRPSDGKWLSRTLAHLARRAEFIGPDAIDMAPSDGGRDLRLLLTFDDGFRTNRIVAEEVLRPLGIRALFFVTSGFVGLRGAAAIEFVRRNFYPARYFEPAIDGSPDAMDRKDLSWLLEHGHAIGAHTASHPVLSRLSGDQQRREIVDAADALADMIGGEVAHFAYPFGALSCVDDGAVKMAGSRFRFAYSNIRGSVAESPSPHFVYRQNVVPGMPLWMVDAVVEGRLDWRYRKVRREAQARFSERSNGR